MKNIIIKSAVAMSLILGVSQSVLADDSYFSQVYTSCIDHQLQLVAVIHPRSRGEVLQIQVDAKNSVEMRCQDLSSACLYPVAEDLRNQRHSTNLINSVIGALASCESVRHSY